MSHPAGGSLIAARSVLNDIAYGIVGSDTSADRGRKSGDWEPFFLQQGVTFANIEWYQPKNPKAPFAILEANEEKREFIIKVNSSYKNLSQDALTSQLIYELYLSLFELYHSADLACYEEIMGKPGKPGRWDEGFISEDVEINASDLAYLYASAVSVYTKEPQWQIIRRTPQN